MVALTTRLLQLEKQIMFKKNHLILNQQKKPTSFVLSNFLRQVQKSAVFLLVFSSVNVILGVKHLFSALIMAWFLSFL